MYDRKTWIVLIACSALLVTNLYFSAQNQKARNEALKREQKLAETKAVKEQAAEVTTEAELTVEPPPPSTEEELVVLANDRVEYTLTNIGGGIKYAEFKNEFEVGSKTVRVRANRFGNGPIGTIGSDGGTLQNVPYTYKADESVEGRKAVYIAKLPSGLIFKKTYTL
ncbi:MAG TPA: hypothetical protein VLO11_00420, partial [Luteolibacter sp.]|nr:hypothetical protein [Luteolibacter sp.]